MTNYSVKDISTQNFKSYFIEVYNKLNFMNNRLTKHIFFNHG